MELRVRKISNAIVLQDGLAMFVMKVAILLLDSSFYLQPYIMNEYFFASALQLFAIHLVKIGGIAHNLDTAHVNPIGKE